jgi:hypothetical protein
LIIHKTCVLTIQKICHSNYGESLISQGKEAITNNIFKKIMTPTLITVKVAIKSNSDDIKNNKINFKKNKEIPNDFFL